jgi:hypothetical protein
LALKSASASKTVPGSIDTSAGFAGPVFVKKSAIPKFGFADLHSSGRDVLIPDHDLVDIVLFCHLAKLDEQGVAPVFVFQIPIIIIHQFCHHAFAFPFGGFVDPVQPDLTDIIGFKQHADGCFSYYVIDAVGQPQLKSMVGNIYGIIAWVIICKTIKGIEADENRKKEFFIHMITA